ncbi:sn-glycerol-3-phosphate ABC transporter ATP-binding protein UgpC [Granulosicoccus antarcticus]|uniref:sn-glycerol-3-phosphate import ATP-binding protein UgpC n=1 Tax=Granulosicoccus antarcticus IMCC3135 TaxID=1192854 RepID=A0A2Z2NRN7_9GAMM|nr:sn-glycerol-3-phosphate ABC transporter ATP-binding protein UgpC [Granulosicoccus antarcticus]ASJ72671.1 sn-glycerol-3-phosphate import ATP-binding protein UgpC [Granulosicoccus antarcticus IMCC3135]
MSTVTLSDVRKSYGREEIIHGVNIDIADKEFIVIVGPSGCGKSTLLRMIAGLETISAGSIMIGERVVNDLEPMERNIAMVFQNYALYPHMSVFDNMAYSLKIAKLDKADIRERVEKAAQLLQLSDYLQRKPRELSGGQRQRVAMGRAIVRKPDVFLFDEPLSNLDAKLRVQMRLEIRKLQRDLGVTSVYVTHDQVEAMTLGDRLMVLNGGHVEQFGTPIELYEKPATRFVADFIGSPSMNIFRGESLNGTVTLENGVTIPSDTRTTGTVDLGIRPEHLLRSDTGPLIMETGLVEQLGSNTLIHGFLAGTRTPLIASLQGVHSEASLGAELRFEVPVTAQHVFSSETGSRL